MKINANQAVVLSIAFIVVGIWLYFWPVDESATSAEGHIGTFWP